MSISRRSQIRTIVLAIAAAASFTYSAIFHFDVAPSVMLEFLLLSVLMLVVCIGFAWLLIKLLNWLRR